MLDGVQVGQQQRRGVPGGHHGDIGTGEPVHVVANSPHQPVDQSGEAENGAGLHALDGVLADHRPGPDQLDAAQRRRPGGRGVRGHLNAGRDRTPEELALGRDHVDADR